MPVHEVDRGEAVKLLTKAVAKRGDDFVYPDEWRSSMTNCLYFVLDEKTDEWIPACIVGMVFDELGIKPTDLVDPEFAIEVVNDYLLRSDIVFDSSALEVLERAQEVQDAGHTWGEAFTAGITGNWPGLLPTT